MVYLTDMPDEQRTTIVDQDLPNYQNSPCFPGPRLSERKIR